MYTDRDQILRLWQTIDVDCFELAGCNKECFQLLDSWIEKLGSGDELIFNNYMEYFCGIKHKSLKELTCHIEKTYLIWALLKFHGNQSQAAKFLHIDYKTLARKIKAYNIKVASEDGPSKKNTVESKFA
jgi:DNA-binding protein Fis